MCFIVQCFALLSFPFPRPRFSILENAKGIFTVTTPPVAHKVHASFSPWQLNDMRSQSCDPTSFPGSLSTEENAPVFSSAEKSPKNEVGCGRKF